MKKTELAEDAVFIPEQFEITDHGAIAIKENAAITTIKPEVADTLLDKVLVAIKWIFLFLPGTVLLHLIGVGTAYLVFFSLFYNDWSFEAIVGLAGGSVAASFMMMLGMGKLSDLKYLRVVFGVFTFSLLAGIVFSVMAAFIPGDYLGFFTRLTMPLSLLAGLLLKRHTDRLPSDEPAD